jgi:hypothetical protein
MLSMLIVALLSLPPEPKLSDADDFNAMVVAAEKELECEAYRLRKSDPDDVRLVHFTCKDEDVALVFMLRTIGDWVVLPRQFRCARGTHETLGI